MATDDSLRWLATVKGNLNDPGDNKLVIVSRDGFPRILLEIDVPDLLSAGAEQRQRGRAAIQVALTALQQALDSPTALGVFRPN